MFKVGIYSKQLTLIMVFLGILAISPIAHFVDSLFTPASAQPLVKSASTEIPVPKDEDFSDTGIHKYCHSDSEIEHAVGDYQIRLYDDVIVIQDGDRIVGTLTYKTSLGRMMIHDNE